MAKRLWSVFTNDMDHCMFTGSPYVERHHIYGAFNKKNSEVFGFVVPLRYDLHPNGANADRRYAKQMDDHLKKMGQEYFEKQYGSRQDFIDLFGRSYL